MDAARKAWLVPVGVFTAVAATVVAVSLSGGAGGNGGAGSGSPRKLPVGLSGAQDGGAPAAARAEGMRAPMYYGWSPYRLVGELPSDLPKEAPAFRVGHGKADETAVRRLAAGLGMTGEPKRQQDHWYLVDGDRALMVWDHSGQAWSYGPELACKLMSSGSGGTDGSAGTSGSGSSGSSGAPTQVEPDRGTEPAEPAEPGEPSEPTEPTKEPEKPSSEPAPPPPAPDACTSSSSGTVVACPPDRPCEQPSTAPQPSDEEALTVARKVLTAVGYNVTDGVLRVHPGWGSKSVTFSPNVGGLPTMFWDVHIEVDAEREVRHAAGHLAAATREDTYPLLTVAQAIERVNKQAPTMPRCDAMTPECQKEPEPRDVTGARLGLVFHPAYDGASPGYLVPSWLLTVKDGGEQGEPLHALPDEYMEKAPEHGSCDGNSDCPQPMPAPAREGWAEYGEDTPAVAPNEASNAPEPAASK